jgi:UDP-N-acetylglucosamine 2-epimerase
MIIASIVGARPQFIKAAPLSRRLRQEHSEILIHTGQHYDANLSQVFFEELRLPVPDYNLGVGSGGQGAQTGRMLEAIENVLLKEKPDWVIVYGDTNSTLAGALAAAKLHIPVAHIEAGLRSNNRRMPEEINRILTDHISELLFCPSENAVTNLGSEGIYSGVHNIGDIMVDSLRCVDSRCHELSPICAAYGLVGNDYLLATIHRAENTDDPDRLSAIFLAINQLNEPVILPLHPRSRLAIEQQGIALKPHIHPIEPSCYCTMVALEKHARMILTDSGGVQKEAYWLSTPCITLRDETEWMETVTAGWNILVGADTVAILRAVESLDPPLARPTLYGDGYAAERAVDILNKLEK